MHTCVPVPVDINIVAAGRLGKYECGWGKGGGMDGGSKRRADVGKEHMESCG